MANIRPLKVNTTTGDFAQFADGDTLAVGLGGTGAVDAAGARTNLGAQEADARLDEIVALELTKGDIMVFDGTNVTKLDVGSNGYTIVANSSAATGLEWVATVNAPESTFTANNGTVGAITRGQPVYMAADGDVELARANAEATSEVLGFVTNASVAAGNPAVIQLDGVIDNTTTDWDALTGGTGGLVPGTTYFVSTATAGSLTSTVPTGAGNLIVPVLLALSATHAKILDRPTTLLAG